MDQKWGVYRLVPRFYFLIFALTIPPACGQGPGFSGIESISGGNAANQDSDSANDSSQEAKESFEQTDGSSDDALERGSGTEELPTIPGATEADLEALYKCLSKWPGHPFKGNVENYRKIAASVTVGGYGNAIDDSRVTEEPFLILLTAGVNVLGAPTYQLLNPNGYYCINVNVNVKTQLTVNLDCRARLADAKVDVNVLSNQDGTTSAVGVHVLSDIDIVDVGDSSDCLR